MTLNIIGLKVKWQGQEDLVDFQNLPDGYYKYNSVNTLSRTLTKLHFLGH